jgi:hypothetical protein
MMSGINFALTNLSKSYAVNKFIKEVILGNKGLITRGFYNDL